MWPSTLKIRFVVKILGLQLLLWRGDHTPGLSTVSGELFKTDLEGQSLAT